VRFLRLGICSCLAGAAPCSASKRPTARYVPGM